MTYRINFKEKKEENKETKKVSFDAYQKAMKEGNEIVNSLFGDIMAKTERFN